jgi:hypothetical protein
MVRRAGVGALLCVLAVVLVGCGDDYDRADFEQVANGEQVRGDRSAAVQAVRDELTALTSAMPWLDWRAHSVRQECSPESAGLIKQTYWLRCMTGLTAYAGYDGDMTGALRRFGDTVEAAGWNDGSMSATEVSYWGLAGPCGPSLTLSQSWVTPQTLPPVEAQPPDNGPFRPVYKREDPLDEQSVRTEILSRHQLAVVITLGAQCDYDVGD